MEDNEKRVPLGKPIERTDEDLDAMTTASALMGTQESAAADWRANAPDSDKARLDATEEDE